MESLFCLSKPICLNSDTIRILCSLSEKHISPLSYVNFNDFVKILSLDMTLIKLLCAQKYCDIKKLLALNEAELRLAPLFAEKLKQYENDYYEADKMNFINYTGEHVSGYVLIAILCLDHHSRKKLFSQKFNDVNTLLIGYHNKMKTQFLEKMSQIQNFTTQVNMHTVEILSNLQQEQLIELNSLCQEERDRVLSLSKGEVDAILALNQDKRKELFGLDRNEFKTWCILRKTPICPDCHKALCMCLYENNMEIYENDGIWYRQSIMLTVTLNNRLRCFWRFIPNDDNQNYMTIMGFTEYISADDSTAGHGLCYYNPDTSGDTYLMSEKNKKGLFKYCSTCNNALCICETPSVTQVEDCMGTWQRMPSSTNEVKWIFYPISSLYYYEEPIPIIVYPDDDTAMARTYTAHVFTPQSS